MKLGLQLFQLLPECEFYVLILRDVFVSFLQNGQHSILRDAVEERIRHHKWKHCHHVSEQHFRQVILMQIDCLERCNSFHGYQWQNTRDHYQEAKDIYRFECLASPVWIQIPSLSFPCGFFDELIHGQLSCKRQAANEVRRSCRIEKCTVPHLITVREIVVVCRFELNLSKFIPHVIHKNAKSIKCYQID